MSRSLGGRKERLHGALQQKKLNNTKRRIGETDQSRNQGAYTTPLNEAGASSANKPSQTQAPPIGGQTQRRERPAGAEPPPPAKSRGKKKTAANGEDQIRRSKGKERTDVTVKDRNKHATPREQSMEGGDSDGNRLGRTRHSFISH